MWLLHKFFFCKFNESFKNTNFVENCERLPRSFSKIIYKWTADFLDKNTEKIPVTVSEVEVPKKSDVNKCKFRSK